MIGPAGYMDSPRGALDEALIGPNAMIQTARALEKRLGEPEARRILRLAGFESLLDVEPCGMQPEREFLALVTCLVEVLPDAVAHAVLHEAGVRTGAYVLRHRIPGAAKLLVRGLPPRVRIRLVLEAIARHAWTFAGSGAFEFRTKPDVRLTLRLGSPARQLPSTGPLHAYYHGALETLLRALVSRDVALGEAPASRLSRREGAEFSLLRPNRRGRVGAVPGSLPGSNPGPLR